MISLKSGVQAWCLSFLAETEKSLKTILKHLKDSGLQTGKVILAHCLNENAANTLKHMIETQLPGVSVKITRNLGLCSFYAEKGGLLVGYEKF
jgi:hypothetical protein